MSVDTAIKGFFDGLRPIPRLSVSDWADKFRYLSPTASAEPGLWRTDRTPYLKEILDRLSANDITQEIVVMKGAQLGFTEAGNNWIGYIVDIAPAPTLMVMPTDETVKRNSKIRIDPMIEATPRLREKIAPARSRDANNSTRTKDFPGGVLVMTGANSAVGLRSMPVKFLFLDEVDGYPIDLDGEGAPIDLAKARTRTFARKKILMVSTPTIEGKSAIEKEFEITDQRYFHVPCVHCGTMQTLKWERLRWEKGKPEEALYYCEACDEPIEERFKTTMLAQGQWIPSKPENQSERKVGYHINSLYSPFGWYSWAQAAQDWEDAQEDTNKLKTFINTVLGETWKEKGEAPPYENLYNRREVYPLNGAPKDVAFITVGVDVQKDRIELEVVGWCKGKRTYSLDYRTIVGDTAGKEVWEKLSLVVNETWLREDGLVLPMRMMGVDTGYNTQHVYNFCRKHDPTRVIPVKGSDRQALMVTPPRVVDVTANGKKAGHVKVWMVGVGLIKSELYGWLKQERNEDGTAPAGYCHFPQYDMNYFKGLTAEELQVKVNKRGYREYQWVKKVERNEPLDCRVYARAAAAVVGIDRFADEHYDQIAGTYVAKTEGRKRTSRDSSFWS
jgi:phage terminase large subunit GpA-like protein